MRRGNVTVVPGEIVEVNIDSKTGKMTECFPDGTTRTLQEAISTESTPPTMNPRPRDKRAA